jgi:hypothetical protein
VDPAKVKDVEQAERSKRQTPRSKGSDEQKVVSIHDQDTAEIEIPEFARKDEDEKAA